MNAPLIFLDTETTGLDLSDDIWEFAAIRREGDGTPDVPLHMFIEHSAEKASALPEKFLADHNARYEPEHAVSHRDAARLIHRHLRPSADGQRAHIVGSVPNFDTERIGFMFAAHGLSIPWHYHLIDVETLAVGFRHGRAVGQADGNTGMRSKVYRPDLPLPWSSDDLSESVGVTPPTDARHTAMGDAEWARDLWDRITGGVA